MATGVMPQNRVVAHYLDGRLLKGFTSDFLPSKEIFHLIPAEGGPGAKPVELKTAELKALFFVKKFGGNVEYLDRKEFDPKKPTIGRKIRVTFKDGEILIGTTQGYQPGRAGFFVTPADPHSNIERCFVVLASTQEVSFL